MQTLGPTRSQCLVPRRDRACRAQKAASPLTRGRIRPEQRTHFRRTHTFQCRRVSRERMEASILEAQPEFSYRSVFISDLHLGTPQSQAHVLLPFLQQVKQRYLTILWGCLKKINGAPAIIDYVTAALNICRISNFRCGDTQIKTEKLYLVGTLLTHLQWSSDISLGCEGAYFSHICRTRNKRECDKPSCLTV